MNPHRSFHRRFLNRRQVQGLGGGLGGLIGGSSTSSSESQSAAASGASGSPFGFGGVLGGFTSLVGNVPTVTLPSSESSPTTTAGISLTHPSSSSTGSTNSLTSSVHATTISSTSTSTSTPTTPITPTPISTPTPSVSDTVYASSDGTRIVYITSTPPASSATAAPTTSFLQNPSLEGGIFALVGLALLIIVFVAVTWVIRRRRRNRLERDTAAAVTFDPGATDHYKRQEEESIAKHRLSMSSSGHSHGYGYGYGIGSVYVSQQEYHGPAGYGQYSIPYRAPSPAVPQLAAQGQDGANLKRKFSDRKPVPPFLPSSSHDPSVVRVSIPPQFSQQ